MTATSDQYLALASVWLAWTRAASPMRWIDSAPGAVLGLRPMWPCPRIAGRVITVRLRRAEPGEHAPRHLGTAAIEAGGPGTVIVIEHHDRDDVGRLGRHPVAGGPRERHRRRDRRRHVPRRGR